SFGISTGFPELSQSYRYVAHVLLTRPPLVPQVSPRRDQRASRARLACIRHAASVRPEPRSNSPKKLCDRMTPSFLSNVLALLLTVYLDKKMIFVNRIKSINHKHLHVAH